MNNYSSLSTAGGNANSNRLPTFSVTNKITALNGSQIQASGSIDQICQFNEIEHSIRPHMLNLGITPLYRY